MSESPLPWTQADSTRPVYDSAGKLVSFTENAPRILLAVNLCHEICESEDVMPTWARLLAASVVEGK